MAAAKLTGISARLAFYHMSQTPSDAGKSTKDFEKNSVPSYLNSQEEGGARNRGRMCVPVCVCACVCVCVCVCVLAVLELNHVFQLNKRNQIKGFYL